MEAGDRFKQLNNPIGYYQIVGPGFHRELLGFFRSCNSFELMYLVGSEPCGDNFEKVKLDDHYLSYLTLKQLHLTKPLDVTKFMASKYPWFKLAKSIEKEGFRCPLIVEEVRDRKDMYIVIEGRHRFAASSLIEPFVSDFRVPCLVVKRDIQYTVKMWKQIHPHPLTSSKFKCFGKR